MKITLADDRILSYAEYGDSQGQPVFFFHGIPGSRMFHPPDEITRKLHARLICPERPGYGESTFQPGRRLLDWANDIAQLADALNLASFAVAGHSGGGPYVIACAFALPQRVTAAATVSGAGPVGSPGATEGISFLNRFAFTWGRYIPWSIGRLLTWWFMRDRAADPAKAMARDDGHRPPADDELFANPEVRNVCLQSEVEGFRPGLKGLTWDVRLITRSWGFPLENIKVPVSIWHGTADDLASPNMARAMAEKIRTSRLILCEGEGHLLLFPHWQEILTSLIQP
jgi:pimeloyl-ACP methyl ester carboxylesterase